jgi:hypothetical protein
MRDFQNGDAVSVEHEEEHEVEDGEERCHETGLQRKGSVF